MLWLPGGAGAERRLAHSLPGREVNANGQEKAAEDRGQRHCVGRGHRFSNYLCSYSVLTARKAPERLT